MTDAKKDPSSAAGAAPADGAPAGTSTSKADASPAAATDTKPPAKADAGSDKASDKGSEKGPDKGAAKRDGGEPRANKTEPPRPARAAGGPQPDKDGIVRIDTRAKGRLVEPSLEAVDALDCDSLVIHLASDVRPLAGAASYVDWRLCGRLSALVERGVITGRRGEQVLLPTHGRIKPVRIFVFGWGSYKNALEGATDLLKTTNHVLSRAHAGRVAIALPEPAGRLVGLVDEHIVKPLGDSLACVFAPDGLLVEQKKDTRPIPAPAP